MKKDNLRSSLWCQEWCVQLHKRSTPARRGGQYAVRLPAVVGCTKKGFTMAEILIALTILTIGLVSILSLFPVGLKASKRAGDLNEVALCAQEIFEGLKLCNYTDSLLNTGTNYVDKVKQIEGVDTNTYTSFLKDFTDDLKETRYVVTDFTGYKKIDLFIAWIDAGRTNEEGFVTYRADYE